MRNPPPLGGVHRPQEPPFGQGRIAHFGPRIISQLWEIYAYDLLNQWQ